MSTKIATFVMKADDPILEHWGSIALAELIVEKTGGTAIQDYGFERDGTTMVAVEIEAEPTRAMRAFMEIPGLTLHIGERVDLRNN